MQSAPLIRAEVDLGAISHNTREFKRIVGPDVRVMPAVKADGYGHGALQVSQAALENGASDLGVARIEEGIALRKAGIDVPILVFGYVGTDAADELTAYNLTATVSQVSVARALSDAAMQRGERIKVHVKVDTGMGRIGLLTRYGHPGAEDQGHDCLAALLDMARMPGLNLEGLYTHLAASDSADKMDAKRQVSIFKRFITDLEDQGLKIPLKHAANSAGAIGMPESHLDMIRPGISFYGLPPSPEAELSGIDLKPAMQLKARIISLKAVKKGFRVSYGSTHVVQKDTVIAAVPVGYADGFSRHFSNNGHMLVRGTRCPIVGRVCMDLTMIDVGDIIDPQLEEEVVIFGSQMGETLSVDELARRLETINYEIVSNLSARVKRVYI